MNKKPIFVIGTPRSGTILTAQILGCHSDIFMPSKTHCFDDIISRSSQLGDPLKAFSLARIAARLYTLYVRYYEPCDQDGKADKILVLSNRIKEALVALGFDSGLVFVTTTMFDGEQMKVGGAKRNNECKK